VLFVIECRKKNIVQPDRPHDTMTCPRSRNYCCRGKATFITYSECVCVCRRSYAACNIHALCYTWPVRLYHNLPHYL